MGWEVELAGSGAGGYAGRRIVNVPRRDWTVESNFCHLHLHTEYSVLDGLCALDRGKDHRSPLMERAQELGQTSIAITDHGNLFGTVHFYQAARRHGLKPILGCEVYVTPGNHQDRVLVNGRQANHLVLLAEDATGWFNLVKLVSKAHLEGYYYKPRIDRGLLAQHHEGLIALSACLKGEVSEAIVDGDLKKARELAATYSDIMGKDNFFLEIQDHGIEEQHVVIREMTRMAKELNLPLVATNDVHYLRRDHAEAHEMLLCLQTQAKWSDVNRMRYGSDQFYLKSADEMAELFGEFPEALANTGRIADRCFVELALGGQKNPHFPIYECPDGLTHRNYLIQIAKDGIKRLYDVDLDKPEGAKGKEVAERFWHELGVIEKTGFVNYFLVVWDFIHAAKEMKIPVGPGRGSGAGSLIAYVMGITGIDPLRYGLIFERFLNPDRVSPPDFDIDFCQQRRGEVIEYVRQKYGQDSVAQIVTYGTLGAKTLIRDIGRAFDFPLSECDKIAKMIPDAPGTTLASACEDSGDFKEAIVHNEYAREIMKYAPQLEDMPRQTGVHAAGVVIGDMPLMEFIPLMHDKEGSTVAQWEAGPLEMAGLLKMDFLGLKTLTVVAEACAWIKKTKGIDIPIDDLPLDDPKTFELLGRGDTVGVFQVESTGMRELLKQLQMTKIEELIAMIALYRPGPMQMIPTYIARKHGREPIEYDHPLLEPVLKETYGVMLYQEQVQQAAAVLAGFSMGQGDVLRRAMGKKKEEEMAQQREAFIEGCRKKKTCDEVLAGKIFDNISKFAAYGFNKSHSAAYGIVTFQTAYLKANYPVEFMAALLSSEMGNTDKLPVLMTEAREMGISILPPDVNESYLRFAPVQDKIRYGLAGIKGVGVGAVEAMISEREASGPYKGFVDFCERLETGSANKKTLEALVKCGAFDFTGISRGRLFEGIEAALAHAVGFRKDKASGQTSLFDMLGGGDSGSGGGMTDDELLPPAQPWPDKQMLAFERELIGFYLTGHPLLSMQWTLATYNLHDVVGVMELADKTQTRVGGLITNFKKRMTKPKGEGQQPRDMGTFTLETLDGSMEAVLFPDTYQAYRNDVVENKAVMMCGRVKKDDKGSSFMVEELWPLSDVPERFTQSISLHIPVMAWSDEKMILLRDFIGAHPGKTQLFICLIYPTGEKVFIKAGNAFFVKVTEPFIKGLEKQVDKVFINARKQACMTPPSRSNGKWRTKTGKGR